MKWYWQSTATQVSGARKCITMSHLCHSTLCQDSVFSELRGWLSRYKKCHGHIDSNISLCNRKLSIIDKNVWKTVNIQVGFGSLFQWFHPMVTGPWVHQGGSLWPRRPAHLMVARKQREKQEGTTFSISPSRACPQQPHFLSLDPTSLEFHFLPNEHIRIVTQKMCQHTDHGQLFKIQTAAPWEKMTKWQKILYDCQEATVHSILLLVSSSESISMGKSLKNWIFHFYFWIFLWLYLFGARGGFSYLCFLGASVSMNHKASFSMSERHGGIGIESKGSFLYTDKRGQHLRQQGHLQNE